MRPAAWSALGFILVCLAIAFAISSVLVPAWVQITVWVLVVLGAACQLQAERVEHRATCERCRP